MRAFDLATSVPWAVTEDMLRTMLEIAARENMSSGLEVAQAVRSDRLTRQALMFADGRRLDGARSIVVRDGVAIQLIEGPIFRRADFFTEVSGGAAVETLAKDFNAALESPNIQSILMVFDSPGGEVTGINEFASAIYAARGRKPITAYVEGIGASAAYWLASAADEIVIDPTAVVGSIGVVMAVRDPSKTNAKDIEFVSSQSPNKRPNPLTETGKSQLQTLVDDMASVFVSAVALHRDVTAEKVMQDFGAGGMFVGQSAVTAGLVDKLGSFEATLADIQAKATGTARFRATSEGRMSWKSMWKDMFGAMEEYEREVAQAKEDAPPQAGRDAGAPAEAVPSTSSAETTALRQQLAAEQARRFAAEAESFTSKQLVAGKVMPAEQDALKAAYIRAATDDAQYGGSVRVETLSALIDARPAHGLTTEVVPALSGATILNNKTSGDEDEIATVQASARQYAEKRNGNGHAAGKGK